MIIAIPAIGVLVQQAIQAIAVGAVIGAATGAGLGAVVEGVQSAHEQGELNRAVLEDAANGALNGGKDGAVFGGIFGPVGLIVGPVIAPAVQLVDDIAQPVIHVIDDVAKPVVSAVDDVAGPVVKQVGNSVHATTMSIEKAGISALRSVKRGLPTPVRRLLPKTTRSTGYIYILDDAGSGAQKIGLSVDPKRRLGEIKSPSGAKPKIVCTIPTYNMKALEVSMHATYASQNLPNTGVGREWFKLNPAQVAAACSH